MQCLLLVLRVVAEHTDGIELGQSVHLETFVAELAVGTCLHEEYILETLLLAALLFGGDKSLLLGTVTVGLVLQQLHEYDIPFLCIIIIAINCACLIIHLRRLRVDQHRLHWQHFTR